ncbi:MAG: IS3 family transposase [Thermomicrobiales bacterium]
MRKSRYSEEQIIGILREHEAGASVADLTRRHGVSQQTIYRWKQMYGGMETSELRRLKHRSRECPAEDAGGRPSPRQPDAQGVAGKSGNAGAKREAMEHLQDRFTVSERYACRLVGVSRSTVRYQRRSRDDTALVERLRELARARPRFGYRRLHALLRREGEMVNHKRVYRLYRTAGLAVPQRKRKRVAASRGQAVHIGMRPNEHWSLDFMSDTLSTGRRIRTLSVVDTCTREALAIAVATSLPSQAVTRVLDGILLLRQKPERITLDNGPELTSRWFDQWADHHGIALDYIDPGKPVQNAVMESFNGRFRDECLNSHWFTSLEDARRTIEAWRIDYNWERPHSSLGYRTREEVHQELIRPFDGSMMAVGFS